MNLDNYNARKIHLIMSRDFETGNTHVMLISDDYEALCRASEAYNEIATINRTPKHYYVYTAMAYYKK